MDFSTQILSALHEYLDVPSVYPVVYGMNPQAIEVFVGSLYNKLHKNIQDIMQEYGEDYVENNDSLGLALLLIRHGVKLPEETLLAICEDIVKNSRQWAKRIGFVGREEGNILVPDYSLWHGRIYLDFSQDEKIEQ